MSTAIVYYSQHHENTKKLIDAIKEAHPEVKTIDITENRIEDLSQYERIGIASGIYAGRFASGLVEYLKEKMPTGKKVFLLYTYAMKMGHYAKDIKALLDDKNSKLIGEYACQGYNTFGPFKLVGGTAKGHPTEDEIAGAALFILIIHFGRQENAGCITGRKRQWQKI